jgi:hypothetical protein
LGLPQLRRPDGCQSAGFEKDLVEVICAVVEAELGFLEEDGEGLAAQAVELLVAALGITPEALDAVDVDALLGKDGVVGVGVLVDPVMAREACLDQAVIGGKAVRRDLGLRRDPALQDRRQRCFRTVFHDLAMDPPTPFEDAEDGGLAARPAPALAPRPGGSEVALVDLDLAAEGAALARHLGHPEPQEAVDRKRGVVVQPGQFCRAIRRDVEREKPQKIAELTLRNSPPKQVAVFLSDESTLAYSQHRSAVVDPSVLQDAQASGV